MEVLQLADKEQLYFENGTIVAGTGYAAAYFGVSAATLSNWVKSGCPRVKHGYYDIKAVTEWRGQREGEKLAEVVRSDPDKMTPAQMKVHFEARLKEAQLEAARFRNGIASGDYLAKTAVASDLSKFFVILKASVIGLGREIGQSVAPYVDSEVARQMDQLIGERINDALEQLSIDGVYQSKAGEQR